MGEFLAALLTAVILLGAVIYAEFRHKKPRQNERDILRRGR